MRIIRFFMLYIMVSALGLIVVIFLALNHYTVQLDVIKAQYSVNVAWVIVGSAVFGGVITLLTLLPGRIATGLYARTLARDVRGLDRDVVDLEQELEDYEEQRAYMLEQYEMLLERHERMLVRHQTLIGDHSEVVAERDQARAQLTALRIARPAAANGSSHGSAHSSGAATALRLLPQSPQVVPAPASPAARRVTPMPVASVAPPVAAPIADPVVVKPTRVAPAQPAAQRPIIPSPVRVMAAAHVSATSAAASAATQAPEPTTVPVVSAPTARATHRANTPPTDEHPAAPRAMAATPPPAHRNPLPQVQAQLQAGVGHAWQSAGVTLVRIRQQTQQRASALWETAETQAASQRIRLGQLWQRLASASATASAEHDLTDSSEMSEADD